MAHDAPNGTGEPAKRLVNRARRVEVDDNSAMNAAIGKLDLGEFGGSVDHVVFLGNDAQEVDVGIESLGQPRCDRQCALSEP